MAMEGLRPEVVVVGQRDAETMRDRVRSGRHGDPIPVVAIDSHLSPETVVEAIRTALRQQA